ncbi:hypothetical protein NFC73_11425 [Pseudarthrobacter sp. RMG13]|uniref:Uncharacterized protein n=1 Tax=Pseudarthrobacter humi TaxID=2952523 RepID=A0ABT1LQE1_9MICC|nr:hypothetical protein [Pseudarthrobacter humi]MCP9000334.1 hypothetical protein [Pseudarthrobacter humi]
MPCRISPADELDDAVGAGGLQPPAEFVEKGPDLRGGEFAATKGQFCWQPVTQSMAIDSRPGRRQLYHNQLRK